MELMDGNFEGLVQTSKLRKSFMNKVDEFGCLEEVIEEVLCNYASILVQYERE